MSSNRTHSKEKKRNTNVEYKDKHKEEEEEEEEEEEIKEEEAKAKSTKMKENKKPSKVDSKEEKRTIEESKIKKTSKLKGAAKKYDQVKQKDGSDDPTDEFEKLSLSDDSKSCSEESTKASQSDESIDTDDSADLDTSIKSEESDGDNASDGSTDSYQTDGSDTGDESDRDYEPCTPCIYSPDKVNVIIHKMWDTVLDHIQGYKEGLASKTYLVFTIEGMHKPVILDNLQMHAEKKLISIVQETFTGPLKIIIYINNSPCADCATSLKKFLEDNQNIQMVLYIAHLYNIKRRSCIGRETAGKNENHLKFIPDTKHEENYLGLRNLMSLGGNRCSIEAFTKKIWKDLLDVTGLSRQMINNYNRRKKGYDRSRQNEDRRIKKDLNGIKRISDPWK